MPGLAAAEGVRHRHCGPGTHEWQTIDSLTCRYEEAIVGVGRKVALALLALCCVLFASACRRGPLSRDQAADAAWEAFEANTSSRDRGNWEVVEVREVAGREVAEEFEGKVAPGCYVGPTPPANTKITPSGQYWYVHMKARPATPLPSKGTVPPTAPPRIPEASVREGQFLLDRTSGQVVARRIHCVIY